MTVIATGLSSAARKAVGQPPLSVVQPPQPTHPVHQSSQAHGLRTGTDNLPVLNQPVQVGGHAGGIQASAHTHATPQPAHNYEGLNTPSVWRTNRTHAAAKVDALDGCNNQGPLNAEVV